MRRNAPTARTKHSFRHLLLGVEAISHLYARATRTTPGWAAVQGFGVSRLLKLSGYARMLGDQPCCRPPAGGTQDRFTEKAPSCQAGFPLDIIFYPMKKIAFVLGLLLLAITTHIYYVFRSIEGVNVSNVAGSMQISVEGYKYHRHLRLLLVEQDPDALRYLINADCGGGAGCYEHGMTLVQVLIKLGDSSFSGILPKLRKEESERLLNLLSAGHEYGGFSVTPKWEDFANRFPLTFNALHEKL